MNHPDVNHRGYPYAENGRAHFVGFIKVFIFLLAFAWGVPAGHGEEFRFHNALSLQGFTGLLNTPNAEVTEEGKAYFLYSNQKESQWRDSVSRQENYMFSVGLFSFAEVGGRLTEASDNASDTFFVRDLSANFKVRVPFIPRGHYLPQIAFGMQDVGGGAKQLQTKYVVATEEVWRFRFSLGYGRGPNRMDGVFGGVELKTFDWLYLIGEHDTKEKNLGIRLVTPEMFGLPINLHLTAKTSLDYRAGHVEYGIGFQIPLGFDDRKKRPAADVHGSTTTVRETPVSEERLPERTAVERTGAEASKAGSPREPDGAPKQAEAKREIAEKEAVGNSDSGPSVFRGEPFGPADGDGGLRRLLDKLVVGGFQNVRVGTDGQKTLLVIEYENNIYNHNELDGLGVVAGLAADTVSPGFEMVQLVMKKKGILVLQAKFSLSDFRDFLRDPGKIVQLNRSLSMNPDVNVDETVHFIDGDAKANRSWLNSELVVYPALKTYVGTEVGLVDYLLSVKPDYYLNVWKGAVLNARWDIPVTWSENFDDGKAFRSNRAGSQLERIMLFQTVKAAPRVMFNFGAGMVLKDTYGTINELMWTPGSGNHRFMLKQAYLSSSEKEAAYQGNKSYLGSYRYYFGPLDLYLEGTAGQFLDQDRGFIVELKRFFGDTAFSLYYKNSRTEERPNSPSEHVQMGGAQISIPLTPRRDMKPLASVQVKGANEWNYAQEVKIVAPGEANSVNTSIGVDPLLAYNLERVYYNRDRLSAEYIRSHLLRVREAYLKYRD